jgi:hypothetical protein
MEQTKQAIYYKMLFGNNDIYYVSANNSLKESIRELEEKTQSQLIEQTEETIGIVGKTLNENNSKYLYVSAGIYKLNEWWGKNRKIHKMGKSTPAKESTDKFNMIDYANNLVKDMGNAQIGKVAKSPTKISQLVKKIDGEIRQLQDMVEHSEAPLEMRRAYEFSIKSLQNVKQWITELYNITEGMHKEG